MAVTNFKPEIWASKLLTAESRALIFKQLCNRDYEADAQNAEVVRLTSIGDPDVNSYTGTVTYQDIVTAQTTMVLDQKKYIAFKVDDVDRVQAAGNFWTESMNRGAYQLAKAKDVHVAGLYTDAGTTVSAVAITSADAAYAGLTTIGQKLDEADVPDFGRWCVIPPWYKALLLQKSAIIDTSAFGSDQPIRNGYIGRVAGLDLAVSNSVVNTTGDDYACLAGTAASITFADQLAGPPEAQRAETFIGDWVRSLHVYKAKVVKPDTLVTFIASKT